MERVVQLLTLSGEEGGGRIQELSKGGIAFFRLGGFAKNFIGLSY